MKCFRYKIYKGSTLVLTNWIRRPTKEEALTDLEEVKVEHEGTEIKLTEVNPASKWSC